MTANDHSSAHRANAARNLGKIEAAIRKARDDGEQIRAGLRRRHDEVNRKIHRLQSELMAATGAWTAEDERELRTALKERHRLATLMHQGDD